MNRSPPHVFASKLTREKCQELWDPSIQEFKTPLLFNAEFKEFLPQNCGFIKFEGTYLRNLFTFIAEHQDPPKTFEFHNEGSGVVYTYSTRVQFDKRTKPPKFTNMVGLLRAYPTLTRNRISFKDAVFIHGRDCAPFLVTKSVPLTPHQANTMLSRLGIDLSREGFEKMFKKNRETAQKINSKPPSFLSSSEESCN